MKKQLYLILLLASVTLLLSGCLEVNINIGVDDRHNAHLSYDIEMDVSALDPQYHEILANGLNNLGWHYQENLGFVVAVSTDTEIYTLTMRKSVENDSLAGAFESLEAMLTDEDMTAFMQVDMEFLSFPRQDRYIISAMLDIPQMIRLSSAKDLPPDLLTALNEAMAASGGHITLTAPLSELHGHSHDVDKPYHMATMVVPLDYSKQTEFELSGSVNYTEDGRQAGTFDEIMEGFTEHRKIALIAGGSVIGLLLLILLAVVLRKRRY